MSGNELINELTEFVASRTTDGSGGIDPDDRLLEDGIIDSLGLVDLVTFLEKNYGLYVSDSDVNLDTFGSINSVAAYIQSRQE